MVHELYFFQREKENSMIKCRVCNHQEVEGALFCSECGTGLQTAVTEIITTTNFSETDFDKPIQENRQNILVDVDIMALQILEGGQVISLSDKKELTLGRVSDGQIIMPDIDLTDYRAYEFGVSRLHAVLKKEKTQITIMDLGSANGTYLDGVRLKPESEHALYNGSIIALGKLKIQFILNKNN